MFTRLSTSVFGALVLPLAACVSLEAAAQDTGTTQAELDGAAALADLRALSADFMDGRGTGTRGAAIARSYITDRFTEIGLTPVYEDYARDFTYRTNNSDEDREGTNLVGLIEGTGEGGPVMVITAHYDHLGNCDGEICNGADDNASGVAAMIAVAGALVADRPEHDIYIVALDAEEVGLRGARALVADFPIPLERVALNINLDMLAINDENELPAAGAFHFPFLRERIERAGAVEPAQLIQGYDSPDWGPQGDWTYSSDHAAFHDQGIPWIYYGVDFHEHYHQPTDEYEVVHQDFFVANARTVLNAVRLFDDELDAIAADLAEMQANAPVAETTAEGSMVKPGME
ncbi:M20/M25/M40 family metallo-hydrolase [Hyphobacterium marinum]|uniref:M20/M25/M40 family metallo-hydrolase n=1 Tax=Hyphobacterium marinum TaxID=3116574 RepID=A0ABU7LZ84_9PROT|nr:M20/M25/M40 family metallo-hydrolase [Hyphobacterium sp. Y6023]MEE2566877.1 M20/M25/M40 family metallo-hydrolase [Hyphobacterium sp. Y6023]